MDSLITQLLMWIVITGLIVGAPTYLVGVFVSRRRRHRRRGRRRRLARTLKTIGGGLLCLSGILLLGWLVLWLLIRTVYPEMALF